MADAPSTPEVTFQTAEVDQIAKWIKHFAARDGKPPKPCVSFLVGAGFSASAGIPTAGKIVEDYLKPHPMVREKQCPPGKTEYAFYMEQLLPAERIRIIEECVAKAVDPATNRTKVNWGHLLLATLVDAGYVNLLLTTNFDPLIIDALALVGLPVRSFDLTSGQFLSEALDPGSVVYLHGQASGLLLANTPAETVKPKQCLRQAFQEAVRESMLIVVGYSGRCDPVLEELDNTIPQFRHGLYWVLRHSDTEDNLPDELSRLLVPERSGHMVRSEDADTFMRELVLDGLRLEPPRIVRSSLDHLSDSLSRVMTLPPRPGPEEKDPVEAAREIVGKFRSCLARGSCPELRGGLAPGPEPPKGAPKPTAEDIVPLAMKVAVASITGNVQRLNELRSAVEKSDSEDLKKELGSAYLSAADRAGGRGELRQAQNYLSVAERFGVKEPHWLALVSANLFSEQAETRTGEEADRLFADSFAKYAQAVKIKPDMHEAWYNWGTALLAQARTKTGEEADRLFADSSAKFAQAVKIKPDMHEAWNNWGTALSDQAKTNTGEEAGRLFAQSLAKYAQAVKIKPDKHEAWCNWGTALSDQAKTKTGEEADRLFADSFAKFAQAVKIRLDQHNAWNNWGVALSDQAKSKTGAEADRLFADSFAKYAQAVKIKPDMHEAWSNWGGALSAQAQTKTGEEAVRVFAEAREKLERAIRIDPGYAEAHYNLACCAALQGETAEAVEELKKWGALAPKPKRHEIDGDTDFDRIRDDPAFKAFLDSLP